MPTIKIYHKNPYIKNFYANIVKIDQKSKSEVHIKLNRTAFYPEGGGQPCDTGILDGFRVLRVYEAQGEIFHVIDGLPERFENVFCEIDWDRRFDFMQQHLGQHILSAAFEKLFEAETVGFHLTETNLTIDIDKPMETEDLQRAEFFSNQIVFNNLPVKCHQPQTPSEWAALPLRKQPAVKERIRIIEIDQFDFSPCGGTHPKRTGEVGLVKITGASHLRNGMRLEFACGNRALSDYHEKQSILQDLKGLCSCHQKDLPARFENLQKDLQEARRTLKATGEKLTLFEARELLDRSPARSGRKIISARLETVQAKAMNRLSSRILELDPSAVVLLSCSTNGKHAFLLATADGHPNAKEILPDALRKHRGGGGGNARCAQGTIPENISPEKILIEIASRVELELEKSNR